MANNTRLYTRRGFAALAAAGLLSAAGLLNGCGKSESEQWLEQDPQTATLFVFDTVVSFSMYCSEELLRQAEERCTYFEQHFSRTIEGSDVWNINNAKGSRVEVAEETAELIQKSLEYCEMSDGLFDITIGAVSSLWDFTEGVKPKDKQIREAIKHIDYHGVHVEGNEVWLDDADAMIDLGGTAKGYIADSLKQMFEDAGCTSGIIDLGGNVYVLGTKPDGSDWNVGIRNPNGAATDIIAAVACSEKSVVTSGLYERQFEVDGKTYYHILDPKTGYPAKSDLVSSSVLCDSSMDGDAYATWMFLLGHDKALKLLEETEQLEGLVVDKDGEISMTENAPFRTA